MDERVDALEKLAKSLAPLPERVSAMDARLGRVETRLDEVGSQVLLLRSDLDTRTTAILEVIDSGSKATQRMFDEVLQTIHGSEEETRRQMRVLHEDLVERISRLGEARSA